MVTRGATYARRPRDLYATPVEPMQALFSRERFRPRLADPCCGDGAMLQAFRAHGYEAFGCDIHPLVEGAPTVDFTKDPFPFEDVDLVINPPYGTQGRLGVLFILRALLVTKPWLGKVAVLLPVDFDSAHTRAPIFGACPQFAGQISLTRRIVWFDEPAECKNCGGTGEVATGPEEAETCSKCKGTGETTSGPSANHAWFIWDWRHQGPPTKTYAGW